MIKTHQLERVIHFPAYIMDPPGQVILTLVQYFGLQSITLCPISSDESLNDLINTSSMMYVSGCQEFDEKSYYNQVHLDKSLIVCANALSCIHLFKDINVKNRKSLVVLSSDNPHHWKNYMRMRYFDTFLYFNVTTNVITEIYGFKKHIFELNFGTWNETSKVLTTPTKSKWERRSDMQGQLITNTMLPWYPMSLNTTKEDTQPQWSGLLIEALKILEKKVNFTIEYKSPQDGLWGIKVINNNHSV